MFKKFGCFAILLTALVFITSCNKNDDDPAPSSFLKIKKDGVWQTWSSALGEMGPDGFDPSLVDLGVSAQSPDGSERFDLTLQKSGTAFSAGTYDSEITNVVTTTISYITGMTSAPQYYGIDDNGTVHSRYLVNITSITSTTIQGTFSGNALISSNGDVLNVTEGEFSVQRIR